MNNTKTDAVLGILRLYPDTGILESELKKFVNAHDIRYLVNRLNKKGYSILSKLEDTGRGIEIRYILLKDKPEIKKIGNDTVYYKYVGNTAIAQKVR